MKQILPITVPAVIIIALTTLFDGRLAAAPMGTVLTYQGHLDQAGVSSGGIGQQSASSEPVTGIRDFRFSLWDAVTNGNLVSTTQTVSAVSVSNGLFTVALDFGAGAFNGDARWLEIGVRTNGSGAFTELAPRQEAPLMPYALYAAEAGNVAATNFTGIVPDSQLSTNVALLNSSANFIGAVTAVSFTGSGGGLTNLNWSNITNPPAIPSTNGLATTDYVNTATNNFGTTVAVNMTNAANQFTGIFLWNNNLSYGNFFAGPSAGNMAMSGCNNVGIGAGTLCNNTTGTENTGIGDSALDYNTTGFYNIANGPSALYHNTTGSLNTAIGSSALYYNTIGIYNTAICDSALYNNTNGGYNTAIGGSALYNNTKGSNNIAMGYRAGYNLTTGSSNIDIGNLGVAGESNTIRIGTSQTNTVIAGVISGNGGGLTNLAPTNIGSGINTFPSATNTLNLNNGYWLLQTAGNGAIINCSGVVAGRLRTGWLAISNSSGSPIIFSYTAAGNPTSTSINPLPIPAGKMGWFWVWSDGATTNYFNDVSQ